MRCDVRTCLGIEVLGTLHRHTGRSGLVSTDTGESILAGVCVCVFTCIPAGSSATCLCFCASVSCLSVPQAAVSLSTQRDAAFVLK